MEPLPLPLPAGDVSEGTDALAVDALESVGVAMMGWMEGKNDRGGG